MKYTLASSFISRSSHFFSAEAKVYSSMRSQFQSRFVQHQKAIINLKDGMQHQDLLTCSNPNQSCPSPSCLQDDLVWQLVGGNPSPGHESAGQCQLLHTLHMGVLENDTQTTKNAKSSGKILIYITVNKIMFSDLNCQKLPS